MESILDESREGSSNRHAVHVSRCFVRDDYPLLMHSPTPDSSHVPFVQRLERSNWLVELLPSIRPVVAGWRLVRASSKFLVAPPIPAMLTRGDLRALADTLFFPHCV